MNIKLLFLGMFFSFSMSSFAVAAPTVASANPVKAKKPVESVAESMEALPPSIAAMVKNGHDVKVILHFPVEGTDLYAWVVSSNGERRVFYVPEGGKVAILGLVFDENLKNLTAEHAKRDQIVALSGAGIPASAPKIIPMPGFDTGVETQMTLGQLAVADASHVEGNGKDIFVIYDPACSFCHKLWTDTRGQLGKIRIHWIPIAKVSKQSAYLADSILGAIDPESAFAAAVTGRLAPSTSISARTQQILRKNSMILDASGKKNVPYIAFSQHGKAYSFLGAPNKAILELIIGNAQTGAAHGKEAGK